MRALPVLLLLAASATAQDLFPARLQAFEEARRFTLEPGGQARVYPAVEALVGIRDVRAVAPLASYLHTTIAEERRLYDEIEEEQTIAARVFERLEVLDRELKQLDLKEKAGDHTVGPEIEKRAAERMRRERERDQHIKKMERMRRTIDFLRELRERLTEGTAGILEGLEGAEADAGVAGVRRSLDVADREQALHLVRILAASGLAQAEEHLIEILTHPKADGAVRRRAQYALGAHLTRRGAEALVRLWEREPESAGEHARHVLSLAARRRLSTVEEARAWAATLP